jgi:hypothetical protein
VGGSDLAAEIPVTAADSAFALWFAPQHFPSLHGFSQSEPQQALAVLLLSQSEQHLSLSAFMQDFASLPPQHDVISLASLL